jgi:hypothetical protein
MYYQCALYEPLHQFGNLSFFSKLDVMRKIENVLQSLYIHIFVIVQEKLKSLLNFMKTKGQQILKNIKTHNIFMMPHLREFWVNAWYGGSISMDNTFHKNPFSIIKMVAYYYIII